MSAQLIDMSNLTRKQIAGRKLSKHPNWEWWGGCRLFTTLDGSHPLGLPKGLPAGSPWRLAGHGPTYSEWLDLPSEGRVSHEDPGIVDLEDMATIGIVERLVRAAIRDAFGEDVTVTLRTLIAAPHRPRPTRYVVEWQGRTGPPHQSEIVSSIGEAWAAAFMSWGKYKRGGSESL